MFYFDITKLKLKALFAVQNKICELNCGMFLHSPVSSASMPFSDNSPRWSGDSQNFALAKEPREKPSSFSKFCLAAQCCFCEGGNKQAVEQESLSWWTGLQSTKSCQCQAQPHISKNWNLVRFQGEETVLVLIFFSWEVIATCKLSWKCIDTYSIFTEKNVCFLPSSDHSRFSVCALLGLKRYEQFLSLTQNYHPKLQYTSSLFLFFLLFLCFVLFCLFWGFQFFGCVFQIAYALKGSRYF